MSDVIQLLPDSVANQIAAGEVIQRPASVVKELVENAVDAGAKHIDVLIVDAGRTSIQVIDDGKGMSETDARLAFERHATSKIRHADDLFSLRTMGFRGEALPSIAAVAQVELRTRLTGEEIGTHLSISASKFMGQEPCSCPEGSNFMVESLFFNVPARRKFLKSNATELSNILTAFERIVLVYPSLAFTLRSNDSELFNLRPASPLQRIMDVFGKKINSELLPVKVDTSVCRISGYVGKPEAARKKGAHQYFFVNGRFMRHPYFNKAVMSAFDRLVPQGEQVPYFIYFDVSPDSIDVNIHPTKTEIKFDNEQAIWQILSAAVRESIGLYNEVPSIDFDTEGKPDIPVFNPGGNPEAPRVQVNPQYNPFQQPSKPHAQSVSTEWDQLYSGLDNKNQPDQLLFGQDEEEPTSQESESIIDEKSPVHYQYKGKYIMTAVKSGLMIIDQHRAHVRILYEQYLGKVPGRMTSQKEMFPEIIHFTPSEKVLLGKMMDDLHAMGFELTDLGNGDYSVNGVPSGLDGLNPASLVRDMVAASRESEVSGADEIRRSMALSLARNAAIPQGQVLDNNEMEDLINRLFACNNPNYTPDGNPILCILRQQEIEHLLS